MTYDFIVSELYHINQALFVLNLSNLSVSSKLIQLFDIETLSPKLIILEINLTKLTRFNLFPSRLESTGRPAIFFSNLMKAAFSIFFSTLGSQSVKGDAAFP